MIHLLGDYARLLFSTMRFITILLALFLHISAYAAPNKNMDWNNPLDPAVITEESVVAARKPILLVIHDEGHGGWQFMSGGDITGQNPKVITKEEILKLDPTLKEVIDLPVNWEARRANPKAPWVRQKRTTNK